MTATPRKPLAASVAFALIVASMPFVSRAAEKQSAPPEAEDSADGITLALARLAIETEAGAISEPAFEAAKIAILDALGCAFASHEMPGVPAVIDLTRDWEAAPRRPSGSTARRFPGRRRPSPTASNFTPWILTTIIRRRMLT